MKESALLIIYTNEKELDILKKASALSNKEWRIFYREWIHKLAKMAKKNPEKFKSKILNLKSDYKSLNKREMILLDKTTNDDITDLCKLVQHNGG